MKYVLLGVLGAIEVLGWTAVVAALAVLMSIPW